MNSTINGLGLRKAVLATRTAFLCLEPASDQIQPYFTMSIGWLRHEKTKATANSGFCDGWNSA